MQDAINSFYKSAFTPELIYALNVIEETKVVAEIMHEFFKLSGEDRYSESFTESKFQINLLYIQKKFEVAFSSLKLEYNHIQFIDGIDIRPRNIEYEDYLECVKGLANAVWTINTDFFANIKDTRGRIKVMMLVRPDIFSQLGLQNQNNKIRDNGVMLDWKTTYSAYRKSNIFKVADTILSTQQSEICKFGECWDYYFPFINETRSGFKDESFISFLRFSMFKPRDIITMMKILQENLKADLNRKLPIIDAADFETSSFRSKYSDYLLSEIKDYLAFYHSDADYELFLKYFEFLNGKASFNYAEFMYTYNQFADYIERNEIDVPPFFESSDRFLQFLYDLNVICYIEDIENESETHIHWSFRDRSYSNINPKVKEGVRYSIHYGLQKAFNTGKRFEKRIIKPKRKIDQ